MADLGGRAPLWRAILIYIFLLAAFFLSNFYRISTSVILPDLARQWRIDATVTSLIAAIFFYAYAIVQPFCGLLNERFSSARVAGCGLTLAMFGTLAMALAPSAPLFAAGRLLAGLGLAPMLSGALVFQTSCFSHNRYAELTGITYMVGNLGTVLSVAPLSWLIGRWGFRRVFLGLACLCFVLGVTLYLNRAANRRCQRALPAVLPRSLKDQLLLPFRLIWQSRQLKAMLPAWVMMVGSLMTFQSLWAVEWYQAAFQAGGGSGDFWATLVGVGVILGNFLGGQMSRLVHSRRKLITAVSMAFTLVWIAEWILLYNHWSLPAVGCGGLLLGFCGGTIYTQMTAGVNDVAPPGTSGIIFGVINCLIFLVVVALQFLSGFLIDFFSGDHPTTPQSFSYAFAVIVILVALSQVSLTRLAEFLPRQLHMPGTEA